MYGREIEQSFTKIVGIGDVGCFAASQIEYHGEMGFKTAYMLHRDDWQSIPEKNEKLVLEELKGIGDGKTDRLFADTDMMLVVLDLGDASAVQAAKRVAGEAKDKKILTVGFFLVAESDRDKYLDATAVFDAATPYPYKDINTGIDDAVENIGYFVNGVLPLIYSECYVNLDLSDLSYILRNSAAMQLSFGVALGGANVIDAANDLLSCNRSAIDGADGAIISVCVSEEASISDVQNGLKLIIDLLSPNANIIWGLRIEEKFNCHAEIFVVSAKC